jgi:ATP-binding cassette subfamily B protein
MWFKIRSGNLREADIRVSFLSAMIERSVNVAVLLLHLLILGFGAYLTFQKQLTIGALVTFESVFWELSYNIGHLTQFIPEVIQAAGSVRHIEELFDEPPFAPDGPNAISAPKFEQGIVFEDVSFSFEGRGMQLRHINFEIPHGKFVAVVGPSGAGKSALLGLLLRLYDPTEGKILMDGRDIRDFSLESYRSNLAVVFQDNILFSLSLRENIRLGNPEATDSEVERAAREAEIHDFIIRQPEGYETVVGERGATLSGGQRQRIAIARAILRNPSILILDEATSALDVTTETAINRTLRRISAGRTVVCVTHRLATIADADFIHVLNKGKLVETGSHRELSEGTGLYARMWEHQARAGATAEVTRKGRKNRRG